jgi:WD40 repeat protein
MKEWGGQEVGRQMMNAGSDGRYLAWHRGVGVGILAILFGFLLAASFLSGCAAVGDVTPAEGTVEPSIAMPTQTVLPPASPTLTPTEGPFFPSGLDSPLGGDWPAITTDTAADVEMVYEHHVDGLVEVLGSAEGEYLALITHDWVTFLHGDDLNPVAGIAIDAYGELTAAKMHADTLVLSFRNQDVRAFDVPSGRETQVWDASVDQLALSLDGQFLAGASSDGSLTIWNLEGGDVRYATMLQSMPSKLTFLPDNLLAVELTGDPLERIELWNVEAGYRTETFEWEDRAGPIYFVTFSQDGKTAAWVSRASVLLMDVESGDSRAVLGHEDFVSDAVFAPQSTILATTSAAEVDDEFMAVIDLWDAESGEKLQTIMHGEAAVRIAFSPDGSLLASATYDGVVRLWDLSSTELLREFEGEQDRVFRLFFAHGGRLLVCASWEGPIGIWAVQE